MAQILIVYQVNDNVLGFRHALSKMGYQYRMEAEEKTIFLPQSSMYHPDKKPEACFEDAQGVCVELGIFLENFVATELNRKNFAAMTGQ